MSKHAMAFNGIDGSTGDYLTQCHDPEQIAALARGISLDGDHDRELRSRVHRDTHQHLGPIEGVDPNDLSASGWAVLFPSDSHPSIRDALGPLLGHRTRLAARAKEHRFREFSAENGYRVGDPRESKRTFLARHGVAAGMPADPDRVPYYMLIVADPESIPYSFQFQLDVEYAVGRLWFEKDGKPDLEAFARYAQSIVETESAKFALPRTATFIGVRNEDDLATELSADQLVCPLVRALATKRPRWTFQSAVNEGAKKADLAHLLNGSEVPAVLFTASHGMGFPNGDYRQLPHQGAILCQDWPGPDAWRGKPISPDHYFAADDVAESARLLGLIAFHFACYGAGTPRLDDFPHLRQLAQRSPLSERAFVSRLPQRLLGHPRGGALAVVGHVERAWSCSFYGGARQGAQLQAFQSALLRILDGFPVGYAMEYFNQLYAALSTELSSELEDIKFGKAADDWAISSVWTANNDARSYLVFGDPAVRIAAASHETASTSRRELDVGIAEPVPSPSTVAATTAPVRPGEAQAESAWSATAGPAAISVAGDTIQLTIPIRVGAVAGGPPVTGPEGFAPAILIEPDYASREGYDPEFLGGGDYVVPLPELTNTQRELAARLLNPEPGEDPIELKYHHFSVVLNSPRRLALFTAVNIDGRCLRGVERARDKWTYDPRVERTSQVGDELYGRPFDRGHLVRRLDPTWGRTARAAKRANDDTFHWTNCCPQHWRFNEGKNLWAGLEDYLLQKAGAERRRLTIFSGPVFAPDDSEYEGVRIPKAYWKIAVLARAGRVFALGFVASQEALLRADVSFGSVDAARTFQVPVRRVAETTGLGFGRLAGLDAGSVAHFVPGEPVERELTDWADIRIPA